MTTQLESLIEDLELNHEYCPKDVILAAAAELRRLQAEVEALRADAERLDWCIDILFWSRPGDSSLVTDTGCGCCGESIYFAAGTTGRAAIDAARSEK